MALRTLAEIVAVGDPLDANAAGEAYAASLALAEALGMRPLIAHLHLGLGKLYRRTRQYQKAEEQTATATTMFRELGMPYWLEQAERTLIEPG